MLKDLHEFLVIINNNYAALLSLLSSIVMVIVTIIYVNHTKQQAKSAKDSVQMMSKQIRLDRQPCIIPEIIESYGSAYDASNYTRIQLTYEIRLKNVGDAPAINVFTFAQIETQHIKDANGKREMLSASLLPEFVQAVKTNDEEKIHICFETREVLTLWEDLSINMKMNWERIKTNPTQHHYPGAKLIIRVLYKNIMGQWYESTLSSEIAWLEYKNPPKRRSHNINESTIPPCQIKEGDSFKAQMVSPHYAPFSVKMQTSEYVESYLIQYEDERPEIVNSRDEMLISEP